MQAQSVQEAHTNNLLKKRNVCGTAVGEKWVEGKPTGEDAVLVFVQKKYSKNGLFRKYSADDEVPTNIDGVPTDIIEVGNIVKHGLRNKVRPIKPGYSCGHGKITAGTMGGFFYDKDGTPVILSNNHVVACFDDQTEVLTKSGFKFWSDVSDDDDFATLNTNTDELEYQKPSAMHAGYYNGPMHHYKSRFIDQCVTPNHRLYAKEDYKNNSKKNSAYKFIHAEDSVIEGNKTLRFKRWAKWHCATIEETKQQINLPITDMDSWLVFLGMFLAEGSTTYSPEYFDKSGKRKRGEQYITSVRNLDKEFLDNCKQALDTLGFHCFINYKSGYCRSYNRDLYEYCKQFGKCPDKYIPTEIKQLPPEKLSILLTALSCGDGCEPTRSKKRGLWNHKFTLSSKRLIDDIQELALKIGGTASISMQHGSTFNPKGVYYVANLIKTNLEPKITDYNIISYSGMVYCATVANGILLVRRNGKICWSGNSENRAKVNDPIYQPGPSDSRRRQRIGRLRKFTRINKSNNIQDSGIVEIDPELLKGNLVDPFYPIINESIAGFGDPKPNMQVQKCGRTTGYTTGRVMGMNGTFSVGYDFGVAKFNKCIILSAMSKGGDSGSVILDMDMNAVGLLFAGSSRVTLANPMSLIQQHYGLKIWDAPPAKEANISGDKWKKFTTDGSITQRKGVVTLNDNANHHCFLEHPLTGNTALVACTVNTGSDKGATWGPGLVLQFPDGILKVNLRYNGAFGGCFNGQEYLNVGKVKPNTNYRLRVRKHRNTWVGEVQDNNKWYTAVAIPQSIFRQNPVAVRIGKTGMMGSTRDHSPPRTKRAGAKGKCTVTDIVVR